MQHLCVDLIKIRPYKENYRNYSLWCDVITVGPVAVFVAPCWWYKIGLLFKVKVTGAVKCIL